MPAVSPEFLSAVNGTTHDATNDVMVTSPASGARNLLVDITNERFVTTGVGQYKVGAVAHGILSAQGAVPAPGGNGVVVGLTSYAVTVNAGTGYIEVQQTSP